MMWDFTVFGWCLAFGVFPLEWGWGFKRGTNFRWLSVGPLEFGWAKWGRR